MKYSRFYLQPNFAGTLSGLKHTVTGFFYLPGKQYIPLPITTGKPHSALVIISIQFPPCPLLSMLLSVFPPQIASCLWLT